MVTGLIGVGDGVTRHVCEIFKVYEPGGSTTGPTHASTVSAVFHIRHVLYGEHNSVDTQTTGNPAPPEIRWQILDRAAHPDDTSNPNWHSNLPWKCTGSASSSGHCTVAAAYRSVGRW